MSLSAFTVIPAALRRHAARERPHARLSLQLRLALLVAGTALPLIVFASGVAIYDHRQERAAAFDRVLYSARGMRLVLDSEMHSLTSALQVLALSEALRNDDLAGFRRDVTAFLSQFPETPVISLADAAGEQVLNSQVPPGETPRRRGSYETHDAVFRTGRPAYSRLYTSAAGNPVVTVNVPVFREGKVVYDIAFTPPLVTFQRIVNQQRPDPAWTVAIFDQNGVNFARVPDPEHTFGRRAAPSLFEELFKSSEARLLTTSLEGVELITAYTRSPLTGWTVAAGLPAAGVTAPLWRDLAITAAIGAALLAIGLVFAVRMATEIARAEALHALLINELNHRVKNTLATVQSIAGQTFGRPEHRDAKRKFSGRLAALGRAHDVLSEQKWLRADMREVVDGVLAPYASKEGKRLRVLGPTVQLNPRTAVMVSMVLHELATNAAKYGALSNADGRVTVAWEALGDDRVRLRWKEQGGPPVEPPERKGFGSTLIEEGFVAQLGGRAHLDVRPTGVVCTLECGIREAG